MNSPEWNPSPIADDSAVSPLPEELAVCTAGRDPPIASAAGKAGRQWTAVDWFTPGRFAWMLALLIVAAFPEVTVGLKTFVHRDFGLFGYPVAAYHHQCFWRGE